MILGVLTILTFLQITKTISRNRSIKQAEKELKDAIVEKEQAKVDLYLRISALYGDEICKQVQRGEVWKGMETHLLLASKGKADSIKSSDFGSGVIERWYYELTPQRRAAQKYPMEVRLQNEKVISWHEY